MSILSPPFLHRAQPSLTRLCLNRIPPFSSSFLSINTWSLISSLHRIPPPFLLPAIFLLFSLCLYSWCQFPILFPISLFCSFCLMVRSLCSLCVFMVHVLVWGLRRSSCFAVFLCSVPGSLGDHVFVSLSNLQHCSAFAFSNFLANLWPCLLRPALLCISKHSPFSLPALLVFLQCATRRCLIWNNSLVCVRMRAVHYLCGLFSRCAARRPAERPFPEFSMRAFRQVFPSLNMESFSWKAFI